MKIFQWSNQLYSDDVAEFNGVVDELTDLAVRDLHLEGYRDEQIKFRLELDMRYGMQYNLTKVVSPHLRVTCPEDFKLICDNFTEQYAAIYSPEATFPMGGINVECFYLTAYVEMPPLELTASEVVGTVPPTSALAKSRQAYWHGHGGMCETPVFIFEELEVGNVIEGPALIEARDTTYVLEPQWRFTLDVYKNVLLERV